MKRIISVDVEKLATGMQAILLDMAKDGVKEPKFPVDRFEELIQERHGVSKGEAERVTEMVINTGILRWEIFGNNFVL